MIGKGQRVVFGLLLVLTTLTSQAASQDVCTLDCKGQTPGYQIEDPVDCTRFYICLVDEEPSDSPLSCDIENDEYFDITTQNCEPQLPIPCSQKCIPPTCPSTCKGITDGTVIADPDDCSKYFVCVGEDELEGNCDVGDQLFFNSELGECSNVTTRCCNNCFLYCPAVGLQVKDPKSCNNFYICSEVGVPTNDSIGACPDGEVFIPNTSTSANTGHCGQDVALNPCTPCDPVQFYY